MKSDEQEVLARSHKPDPLLDQLLANPGEWQRLSPTRKLALARYQQGKQAAEAVARRNRETQR